MWDALNGDLVTTFDLDTEVHALLTAAREILMLFFQCTSIACPVSCQVAVVGAASGHLYIVSLTKLTSPTVVEKRLMHAGPITAVKLVQFNCASSLAFYRWFTVALSLVCSCRHDQAGCFMISASPKDPIFLYDSKPSTKFEVLGYLGTLYNAISHGWRKKKDYYTKKRERKNLYTKIGLTVLQ